MRKALFIDRDGTINRDCPYCHDISQLFIYPDIPEIISEFRRKGYLAIVISNQSGIGRGYFTKDECDRFNEEINRRLSAMGAEIDAFYYCPHRPDENCRCRKPGTGLVEKAASDLNIDVKNSFLIGNDDKIDGELARRLGIGYRIIERD
jgi:histidinol-phosphate phosphatase family protein